MPTDDQYMDDILRRKGFKELDDSLRPVVIESLWERLKASIALEIESWNRNCDVYDAAGTKIVFYADPCSIESTKKFAEILSPDGPLAEQARPWLTSAPSFSGSPSGSVCAETVAKDFFGAPKSRVYLWLTQDGKHRILYSYGKSCDYKNAVALPIIVEAGAIVFENGEDEPRFIKRCVRTILAPLMEAA